MQEDYNKTKPKPNPKPNRTADRTASKPYSLDFNLISAESRTEFLSRLLNENPNLAENLT